MLFRYFILAVLGSFLFISGANAAGSAIHMQRDYWQALDRGDTQEARSIADQIRAILRYDPEYRVLERVSSRTFHVRYKNGLHALFKEFDSLRAAQAEEDAHQIDRALEFFLTVPMARATVDGRPGLMQMYDLDSTPGGTNLKDPANVYPNEKMWVFDFMIYHIDRHGDNWRERPNGREFSVDNGSNAADPMTALYLAMHGPMPTLELRTVSFETLVKLTHFVRHAHRDPEFNRFGSPLFDHAVNQAERLIEYTEDNTFIGTPEQLAPRCIDLFHV